LMGRETTVAIPTREGSKKYNGHHKRSKGWGWGGSTSGVDQLARRLTLGASDRWQATQRTGAAADPITRNDRKRKRGQRRLCLSIGKNERPCTKTKKGSWNPGGCHQGGGFQDVRIGEPLGANGSCRYQFVGRWRMNTKTLSRRRAKP